MVAFGFFGFAMLVGSGAGWFFRNNPVVLRRLLLAIVAIALLAWCLLLASGIVRPWQGPLTQLHGVFGHMMLPLVAAATGLWLSGGLLKIRRPTRIIVRLFYLLLLCYCCAINAWTGYLGPSRFDLTSNPAAELRFEILHQVAFPAIIGLLLAFWFGRLVYKSPRWEKLEETQTA